MSNTSVDIGVARQIGSYSDAVAVAANARWLFTSGTPVLIEDIEWFASMRDELGLMRLLADLPEDTARRIMSVNTALSEAEREGWSYVGYKGGSEAGVRNLSWLLRDGDGRWYMLAISQMDPASEIDTTALLMIAKRILTLKE